MLQLVNVKYAPLFENVTARYIILMGGRGAGRSYASSQYGTSRLVAPEYFRCAIMRFVLGDIRNSIFQDILDRLEENEIRGSINIREHLLTFSYGENKINGIGFRKSSGDQKAKLKSLANYTDVMLEEADEVAEEDFMQLDDSLRTKKANIRIILMLNPPDKNHWIIRRFFNLLPSGVDGFYIPKLKDSVKHNTIFIHTTYLDNLENITESSRRNYEDYKQTKPDHYYNMIKGLVSEGKRGLIYNNWKPITKEVYEQLPFEEYHGLDFGYTNDPTALLGIKEHNNRIYLRGLLYERGLVNRDPSGNRPSISKRLEELGVKKGAPIWADSAEPKSIEEIALDGWNIMPAIKGTGSVNAGIDYLLGKEVHYVETDEELVAEKDSYQWALDRNKMPTNTPVDQDNHYMDAARYGVYSKSKQSFVGFV